MRWFLGVSLPIVVSCAAAPLPDAPTAARPPALAPPPAPAAVFQQKTTPIEPEQPVTERAGVDVEVSTLDPRFSTERQVAALERAIALYRQFLDRAGDDPRYAEAVRRSRERIEDARHTLIFLNDQGASR
jgi:hypothetical protein